VWVSINAPGLGSVNLSQATHHLPKLSYFYQREVVDLLQLWRGLDPNYPLVGTPIIFTVVFRSHANNLE